MFVSLKNHNKNVLIHDLTSSCSLLCKWLWISNAFLGFLLLKVMQIWQCFKVVMQFCSKNYLEAGREKIATRKSRYGVVLQLQPFKRVKTRERPLPEYLSQDMASQPCNVSKGQRNSTFCSGRQYA